MPGLHSLWSWDESIPIALRATDNQGLQMPQALRERLPTEYSGKLQPVLFFDPGIDRW